MFVLLVSGNLKLQDVWGEAENSSPEPLTLNHLSHTIRVYQFILRAV